MEDDPCMCGRRLVIETSDPYGCTIVILIETHKGRSDLGMVAESLEHSKSKVHRLLFYSNLTFHEFHRDTMQEWDTCRGRGTICVITVGGRC